MSLRIKLQEESEDDDDEFSGFALTSAPPSDSVF